jgi:hypothetical protein
LVVFSLNLLYFFNIFDLIFFKTGDDLLNLDETDWDWKMTAMHFACFYGATEVWVEEGGGWRKRKRKKKKKRKREGVGGRRKRKEGREGEEEEGA